MAHNNPNAKSWAQWVLANPYSVCCDPAGNWCSECVTLEKHFLNGMTTVPNPFAARGNGKDVASILISRGEAKKITTPQAGAVISYPATSSNPYGHVAVAISATQLVEQSSGYTPNNGKNKYGRYLPRIGDIRPGYSMLALPNGYYEDQPPAPAPAPKPTPAPVTAIKAGDSVIVNGFGTADSYGGGTHTRTFINTTMKVIRINNGHYALNQYNKGTVNNVGDITGWWSADKVRKA
jgi:hypothetical protein